LNFLFREDHLEAFQTMAQCGEWDPRAASPWTKSVGIDDLGEEAISQPLSRSVLKRLGVSKAVSDRDVLWSILAWGGMIPMAELSDPCPFSICD